MEVLVTTLFRGDVATTRQGYIINFLDSVRALVELGFDVHAIAFGSEEPPIDASRELIKPEGSRFSPKALRLKYELYKRVLRHNPEILYVHHAPDRPSTMLLRRGKLRILHAHDIISDIALRIFGPKAVPLAALFFVDERLAARYADALIVPSDLMGEIMKKLGYKRYFVAYNRPGPVEPKEGELSDFIKSLERPVYVYIGVIQPKIRGLEEVARLVKDSGGTLVAIGKKESAIPEGVVYHPPVPRDELIGAIRHADFGVLGRTLSYSLPAKFFDYLYAGLRIVTSSKNRAIVEILERIKRPYVTYEDRVVHHEDSGRKFPDRIKPRKDYIKRAIRSLVEDLSRVPLIVSEDRDTYGN